MPSSTAYLYSSDMNKLNFHGINTLMNSEYNHVKLVSACILLASNAYIPRVCCL